MIVYIKELEEDSKLNKNLIKIIKMFNIHIIKEIYDNKNYSKKINNSNNYIYIIQNTDKKEINTQKIYKNINKIKNKIENKKLKLNSNEKVFIVLSKRLKKYKNEFNSFNLISGKELQLYLLEDILNYILNIIDERIEKQDIYFLINKYNEKINQKIFNNIIEKVKTVNIVTNDIDKYKKIEEKVYNDKSILITVANNKKKSLKKANIIINVDMDNNTISKYTINRNSIIINLSDNKLLLKGFDGIIINNQEIDINKNKEILQYFIENKIFNEFEISELYESILENKGNNDINKIKIISLIGNNGIINKKELLNNKKSLTN